MKILVNCEESGKVTAELRKLGHEAYSCDLMPTRGNPDWHIQDDAIAVAYREHWDMMLAFPPCTFLTNSGAKHLYKGGKKLNGKDEQRWIDMHLAAEFFNKLLLAPIDRIAIENPRMHCHARALIVRIHTQSIQPWQFGHGEIKETRFWLKNLPLLEPTNIVDGRVPRVHHESPGVKNGMTRAMRRSETLQGIAEALAKQFAGLANDQQLYADAEDSSELQRSMPRTTQA